MHSGNINTTTLVNSVAHAVIDGTDLPSDAERGLLLISRGTAVLLLIVYLAYLLFQVRVGVYNIFP